VFYYEASLAGVLRGLSGLDRGFGLLVRGALLAWRFRRPYWPVVFSRGFVGLVV
jgi:hypothetical protein